MPPDSTRRLVYLASPYTDPVAMTRDYRAREVARVGGIMLARGWPVYVPIPLEHQLATHCDLAFEWQTLNNDAALWDEQSDLFLDLSFAVVVLMLEGFDRSRGIRREVRYAKANGLELRYLNPGQAFRINEYADSPPAALEWQPYVFVTEAELAA